MIDISYNANYSSHDLGLVATPGQQRSPAILIASLQPGSQFDVRVRLASRQVQASEDVEESRLLVLTLLFRRSTIPGQEEQEGAEKEAEGKHGEKAAGLVMTCWMI